MGHDPSGGHSEADATASLVDAEARALAVSVGANRLDLTGQATRITGATGGAFYSGVSVDDLAATILAGLSALPVEVGATATCDPGLTATLAPTTQTVTSGTAAVFQETLTLGANAPQGETLTCEVAFTLNVIDVDRHGLEPFVGEVDRKLRLKGDAMMTVTDAAGNTATTLCEVPPNN